MYPQRKLYDVTFFTSIIGRAGASPPSRTTAPSTCGQVRRYFDKAASTGASIATRLAYFDKAASTGTSIATRLALLRQSVKTPNAAYISRSLLTTLHTRERLATYSAFARCATPMSSAFTSAERHYHVPVGSLPLAQNA